MDTNNNYRSILKIMSVVTAVVLVFQSGLVDERSSDWFVTAGSYLGANVGMSVGVAPNELNTFTAELTRQQQLLAEREAAVAEREIAVNLNSSADNNNQDRVTYLLAAVLFVQLVLIVLNYGLDYLRARERKIWRVETSISG